MNDVYMYTCIHLYSRRGELRSGSVIISQQRCQSAVIRPSSDSPDTIKDRLNSDLDTINTWFSLNKPSLNISKTKCMVYRANSLGKRFPDIALKIGGEIIDRVKNFKYLGVVFDENLSWEEDIKQVHSKVSSRLYLFRQIRIFLDTKQSKKVFTSLVQSIMDYANTIWSFCSSKFQNALQKIQNRGLI